MFGIVGSPFGHHVCPNQDILVTQNPFSSHKRKGWAGQSDKGCATLLHQPKTRPLFLVTKDKRGGAIKYWIFVANSLPPHERRKRENQQDQNPYGQIKQICRQISSSQAKREGNQRKLKPPTRENSN